jgi:hypothetical protein
MKPPPISIQVGQIVVLTKQDLEYATQCGIQRSNASRGRGSRSAGERVDYHVNGVIGEVALQKFVGVLLDVKVYAGPKIEPDFIHEGVKYDAKWGHPYVGRHYTPSPDMFYVCFKTQEYSQEQYQQIKAFAWGSDILERNEYPPERIANWRPGTRKENYWFGLEAGEKCLG